MRSEREVRAKPSESQWELAGRWCVSLRSVETDEFPPGDYGAFLDDLKGRIRSAQIRAAVAVNRELILLYWQIGREILERQRQQGWGAKIIDRLSADLRRAFPE